MKILFQWVRVNSIILVNAGSLVGTTAVTSGLGFAYWWLAARQFSPEAVGLASASISAMTLLATFSNLGLVTLLIGELPHHRGQEASLMSAALLLVGGVGACSGIVFAIVAPHLSTDFQILGANSENIALFAIGVSLTTITFVLDQALIGMLRGSLQLWRNTLFAGVKLAALFVTGLWLSHIAGLTIYVTWLIGNAFSLVALAGFRLAKWGWSGRAYPPQWELLRKLGPAALKHHALNLTLQTPSLILPVLVTVLLSATVNAWFYVSWNLASIANIATSALTMTLFAVSSAQPALLVRKIRLTLGLALLVCLVANCVLLFETKQVLDLFGHSYAEQATWSLRILALESFPFIIKSHYIAISRIHGRITHAALLFVVTGLLELGGVTLGAHFSGLTGLSMGWSVAMCIEAVFMSPAVYKATQLIKTSPQVYSQESYMDVQPIWLADTFVLAAIRLDILGTDRENFSKKNLPGDKSIEYIRRSRPHLRRTRLERFSSENGVATSRWDQFTAFPELETPVDLEAKSTHKVLSG